MSKLMTRRQYFHLPNNKHRNRVWFFRVWIKVSAFKYIHLNVPNPGKATFKALARKEMHFTNLANSGTEKTRISGGYVNGLGFASDAVRYLALYFFPPAVHGATVFAASILKPGTPPVIRPASQSFLSFSVFRLWLAKITFVIHH